MKASFRVTAAFYVAADDIDDAASIVTGMQSEYVADIEIDNVEPYDSDLTEVVETFEPSDDDVLQTDALQDLWDRS
jgi:predicted transcriptional regulator